jgi:hypothetical protein
MNLKSALLFLIVSFHIISCNLRTDENQDPVTSDKLEEGFVNPPDTVKPWVYWYWISDNVSREGITRDLEAMARVGIGEAMIGNIGHEEMPWGKASILSEEWWQMVEHAIREGKRVGVNIGMFNCPGWSQSGGPWVKSSEAMRYLVSSEVIIEGGKEITRRLPPPKKIFQDVKVIAYPVPENDNLTISKQKPVITTIPVVDNAEWLADGDTATVCLFKRAGDSKNITIDFETKDFFTARSLSIYPAKIPFAADMDFQIAENGVYRSIKCFRYDRSNSRIYVGPIPFGTVTVAVPEVTAKKFRLIMSNFSLSNYLVSRSNNPSDAGIAEIILSAAPRLEHFIEKQLGKMCQTPFPLWNEYQWEQQEETGTPVMMIDPQKVVDLSTNLSSDGTLTWDAPAGQWLVMRIGTSPTGARNTPSPPHAVGWEVDKMNCKHLKNHFDAFIGELLRRMPPEDRSALKHIVLDSYEQGSENWTDNLAEDFARKYGYDPVPWLPVISGRIVASADQSNRFLWDLRRIIADRIAYDYVGCFRDLCQQNGLRIWLENYGHWGFPSEFLMYGGQSHDIAGEFWNEGELGNIECRAASSAAHIYGKRCVSAESYTSAGMAYRRYPAMLKKRGDWSYTEGINQVVLHLYIHQPYEGKTPGINAWFGTEFNRKNSWFELSKTWIDYQRRCMFMLQRGMPVNDVCYFIGEDVPKMTGTRNPELSEGYSFDYINAEVIMNRMSVKNGRMILPDGMSYRLMVLPPIETMRPELLRKIKQLVKQGASVLGPPPTHSPSLQNYPSADEQVKSISSELWGMSDDRTIKSRKFGKGRILTGMDMQTALNISGIEPDVSFPGNIPLLWIHRKLKNIDIYFITNQSDHSLYFNASFRVSGKQPEIWNAVDGSIRDLPAFIQKGESVTVPLKLDAFGSTFIVFRKAGVSLSEKIEANFPESEKLFDIITPWEVSFSDTIRGINEPFTMTSLKDWSKIPDEKIKYYSGAAVYKNTFTLNEIPSTGKLYLSLGKVGVMAEVQVNGQLAGGIWTAPWQIDITRLVKKGQNSLQIKVVNNWVNRLIGDSRLPEKERKTWINVNEIKPSDTLQPSGLMGPVSLIKIHEHKL